MSDSPIDEICRANSESGNSAKTNAKIKPGPANRPDERAVKFSNIESEHEIVARLAHEVVNLREWLLKRWKKAGRTATPEAIQAYRDMTTSIRDQLAIHRGNGNSVESFTEANASSGTQIKKFVTSDEKWAYATVHEFVVALAADLCQSRFYATESDSQSERSIDDAATRVTQWEVINGLEADLENEFYRAKTYLKAQHPVPMPERTDTAKNAKNNLPTDPEVLQLVNYLKANLPKHPSQIECARAFCESKGYSRDEAENRMRSAFRYRDQWS